MIKIAAVVDTVVRLPSTSAVPYRDQGPLVCDHDEMCQVIINPHTNDPLKRTFAGTTGHRIAPRTLDFRKAIGRNTRDMEQETISLPRANGASRHTLAPLWADLFKKASHLEPQRLDMVRPAADYGGRTRVARALISYA
jgi:hypothetical protein